MFIDRISILDYPQFYFIRPYFASKTVLSLIPNDMMIKMFFDATLKLHVECLLDVIILISAKIIHSIIKTLLGKTIEPFRHRYTTPKNPRNTENITCNLIVPCPNWFIIIKDMSDSS